VIVTGKMINMFGVLSVIRKNYNSLTLHRLKCHLSCETGKLKHSIKSKRNTEMINKSQGHSEVSMSAGWTVVLCNKYKNVLL